MELPKPAFEPKVAVAQFLRDMASAAKSTFPDWHRTLIAGIEECALSVDTRRALLDIHPLDDYYFAGVVALEASKIRSLFTPDEANELLSLIGEQVDAVAERKDRVVSGAVFFIMGCVAHGASSRTQKMPYDQVVKAILQRLGVDKVEATEHLMTEALYRHWLGEPLALGVPHWWNTFHTKYALTPKVHVAAAPNVEQIRIKPAPNSQGGRKAPRRATAF